MKSLNASDVKNRFDEYLDTVMTEPLAMNRNGGSVAVLMSWISYERLNAIEAAWW